MCPCASEVDKLKAIATLRELSVKAMVLCLRLNRKREMVSSGQPTGGL